MKSNFPTSLFLLFSLSIFLLLTLGTWQLNKNYTVNKNNLYFKNSISLEPIRSLNPSDKIRDLSYVNIQGTELINKTLYLEPRTYKGKKLKQKIQISYIDIYDY